MKLEVEKLIDNKMSWPQIILRESTLTFLYVLKIVPKRGRENRDVQNCVAVMCLTHDTETAAHFEQFNTSATLRDQQ